MELLEQAIVEADGEQLDQLLSAGVNVNNHFLNGITPLNLAISCSTSKITHALLELGKADPRLADSLRYDGCRRRPIHYAAACDCLELVRQLVALGVPLDELDFGNATPLHHAAASGNIEIVQHLVENGCNVDRCSDSGRTATWKAAANGHRDVVRYLLQAGASVNVRHKVGTTMLFDCVSKPKLTDIAQDLIDNGINLHARDIEGNTALHGAATLGNTSGAKLLLDAGVLRDVPNEYGNTPLHNAAMHNRLSVMNSLICQGASVNILNYGGQSPLYMAMLHMHHDATILLHNWAAKLTDKELDMYCTYEVRKYVVKAEFLQWALHLFTSPKRLSDLCRCAIWTSLSEKPMDSVSVLPLPPLMKKFLLMSRADGLNS